MRGKINKILIVAIALFILLGINAFAVDSKTAVPNASLVIINGQEVSFEAYTIEQNNYFKLRDLAMVLNNTDKPYNVTWSQKENAINIISGDSYKPVGGELNIFNDSSSKSAVLSNSVIYLNGKQVELKAYTIKQNNYFKLRDLGEKLDFKVDWDQKANSILIDTAKGYFEIEEQDPEEQDLEDEDIEDQELGRPIKIVLDAGHGGNDSGAVYRKLAKNNDENNDVENMTENSEESDNETQIEERERALETEYYEKDFALAMTLKLGALLETQGIEVIYTRTEDVYPTLAERASLANEVGADYFISIHLNSADIPSASGIETLVCATGREAEKLAEDVQAELITDTQAKNRGVKPRPGLYVLRKTNMPAILVETGFMSNEEEMIKLTDDTYQNTVVNAIANGVHKYLTSKVSETSQVEEVKNLN